MAQNTFKIQTRKRKSVFSLLENAVGGIDLKEHGIPVKYIPYFVYVALFLIFYIGNNHYAEKTIRKINRLEVQVEDLRADYTTLKSEYMYDRLQSEVARKVAPMGLRESQQPPHKIEVAK